MATLRDVAQHAGVSYTQASYVLNGRNLNCVSPDRRERIQSAMRDLGYRPHAAARTTRSGRFGAVSLILGTKDGRSSLPMSMLNGIQDALAEHDLNLMVVRLPDERLTDSDYVPRILRETSSDGLLIDYTHDIPERMLELIRAAGIPAVWINSKLEEDCVYPDDFDGGTKATRLLIGQGQRRIAWVDFSHTSERTTIHYSATDRKNGYLNEMERAGLPTRFVGRAPNESQLGLARAILGEVDRPDALVCYSDTTAAPFVRASLEMGLHVPQDLAILSFDDQPPVLLTPQPTSMLVPNAAVGRRAVELLMKKIRRPAEPLAAQAVPYGSPPGLDGAPRHNAI